MRTTGSKVVKKVATMSLAAGIALAASGCQVIVKPDPDDPSKDVIVDITPADPNNPSTDPNTPSTDPGKDKNPEDEQPVEPDYSMYSKTLQNVLTSDYYNDLIEGDRKQEFTFDAGYNLLEAIPYNFLSQQNENVQYIKDGKTRADVKLYTLDDEKNNLYSRVELTYDNGDNDYITQYLIKYDLNNYQQEFEELKMLFQGKYAQANFLFQEIDKQIDSSDVELVSEFSIYESTYNGILKECNMANVLTSLVGGNAFDNYTVLSTSQNKDNTLNFKINLMSKSSDAVSNGQIAEVDLKLMRSSFYSFDNDILYAKDTHSINLVATHEATPITCYWQGPTKKDYKNLSK